jgi:hypothetical protein
VTTVFRHALVLFAFVAACAPTPDVRDAGPDAPDAGPDLDAGRDADTPPDAARDADVPPPVDARIRDAIADATPMHDAGIDPYPVADALITLRCEVRAHAECRAPWACGCPGYGLPPADVETCERAVVTSCRASANRDAVAASVRAGALRVDDALLADCRSTAVRAFDRCAPPARDFFATYRACLHALVGPIPLGAACGYDGLCADGAGFCDGTTCRSLPALEAPCGTLCQPPAACVAGVCALPVAAGGACADDEDCAAPETCVGGVCGPPAAAGEACTATARCAVGLRCNGGRCEPGPVDAVCTLGSDACGAGTTCQPAFQKRCLPRGDVGARCISDTACRAELTCSGDAVRPGVCRTPPVPGERCFERCAEGAFCARMGVDPIGTCAVMPALGDPCDTAWSYTSCGPGRVCDAYTAVCKLIPRLGETCDGLCAPGFGCDFLRSPAICVPALGGGETCDGSSGVSDCAPGLGCDASGWPWICRRIPGDGESCAWSNACAAGLDCLPVGPSGASACVPLPALGAPCGVTCTEGAYCDYDFTAGRCARDACAALPRPAGG